MKRKTAPNSPQPSKRKTRKNSIFRPMQAKIGYPFLCVAACLSLAGCRPTVVKPEERNTQDSIREELIAAQGISVKQELESIAAFCRRSGWNMQESGTGLRYDIYRKAAANAPKVERGDAVKISYTLYLLNGEEIASSEKNGLKTFIVGESDVESGLTEAVLLMKKGEKARLIIPSHLAHGFSGDGKLIPPGASLLYEIEIEDILVPPNKNRPEAQKQENNEKK